MNPLNTKFSARPALEYPFERGFSPEPGKPFEVVEGVFWLRVPLPISLDHINLWLLRDGESWVIVDSGYDDPMCKQIWETVFAEFCSPQQVSKIFITHYHPDHIGLASWLAHQCGCKVHITQGEFARYRKLIDRAGQTEMPEVSEFIHQLGFSEKQKNIYTQFFSVDEKPAKARLQNQDCIFIQAGEKLEINSRNWQIVVGNGHSPEHACLYCADLKVMIAGDQALPRISSNISVYYTNRDQNPLADWLSSCARLKLNIPADTLVLPAHQEPFVGLDLRMQQLIDDHHAQLNKLRLQLSEPASAVQACKILFNRELNEVETLLATGETLAHINYLIASEELHGSAGEDGVFRYQPCLTD